MSRKNCHPLQDENLCLFQVQNSQRYLNKKSLLEVFVMYCLSRNVYVKEFKIKLIFQIFEHVV